MSTTVLAIIATLICVLTNSLAAPAPGTTLPAPSGPRLILSTPLSTQHLPVARLNQSFSFTLAPDTFLSLDSLPITYAAYGAPPWLSFDTSRLTLSGTPTTNRDIGTYPIEIRATLASNASIQCFDTVRIKSSALPSPVLNEPFLLQLAPGSNESTISSAYPYPTESRYAPGVRVPPGWSFSIGLQPFTFSAGGGSGRKMFFSAEETGGEGLPSWLKFDNTSVTFYGVAPWKEGSEGSTYRISVFGSDYFGYQDISQSFNLTVSSTSHILSVTDQGAGMNVTAGSEVVGGLELLGGITLDGEEIINPDVQLAKVDTTALPWLSFDEGSKNFGGTPPAEGEGQIGLNLTDTFGDTLLTNVTLRIFPSVFNTTTTQITQPQEDGTFETSILHLFTNSSATSVELGNITYSVVPTEAASWVHYSSINQTFSGTPPPPTTRNYSSVVINLASTSPSTNAISHLSLTWPLSAFENPSDPPRTPHNGLSTADITAIVVLAAFGAVVLLMIPCFCLCRNRYSDEVLEDFDSLRSEEEQERKAEEGMGLGLGEEGMRRRETEVPPFEHGRNLSAIGETSEVDTRLPTNIRRSGDGSMGDPYEILNSDSSETKPNVPALIVIGQAVSEKSNPKPTAAAAAMRKFSEGSLRMEMFFKNMKGKGRVASLEKKEISLPVDTLPRRESIYESEGHDPFADPKKSDSCPRLSIDSDELPLGRTGGLGDFGIKRSKFRFQDQEGEYSPSDDGKTPDSCASFYSTPTHPQKVSLAGRGKCHNQSHKSGLSTMHNLDDTAESYEGTEESPTPHSGAPRVPLSLSHENDRRHSATPDSYSREKSMSVSPTPPSRIEQNGDVTEDGTWVGQPTRAAYHSEPRHPSDRARLWGGEVREASQQGSVGYEEGGRRSTSTQNVSRPSGEADRFDDRPISDFSAVIDAFAPSASHEGFPTSPSMMEDSPTLPMTPSAFGVPVRVGNNPSPLGGSARASARRGQGGVGVRQSPLRGEEGAAWRFGFDKPGQDV